MSFGADLENNFHKFTDGYESLTEEELNAKLDDSLLLLASLYKSYHIKLIHGARSHVEFMHGGVLVRKELADMMFLIYHRAKDKCKLMYLQNKNATRMSSAPFQFKADMEQYYLLNQRPSLDLTRCHPSCVPHQDILKNAVIPSVGAYGVFYRDGGRFQMNYYPADRLAASARRVNLLYYSGWPADLDTLRHVASEEDSLGCSSLQSFGDELIQFRIGTLITPPDYAAIIDYLIGTDTPCGEYRDTILYQLGVEDRLSRQPDTPLDSLEFRDVSRSPGERRTSLPRRYDGMPEAGAAIRSSDICMLMV